MILRAIQPQAPRSPPPPRGLRIAHRGGLAHGPENSLEAIEAAASHGADAVELDVRMRKGALVCAHDRGQSGPPAQEALRLALSLGLRVEFDLKGTGFDDGVRNIIALFATTAAWDRAWVSTFHPITAWRLRRADPRIVVGWSIAPSSVQRLPLWTPWPNWLGVQVLEPHVSLITDARLAHWHEMGLVVETWGVEPDQARSWLSRGVSVVIDRLV